MVELIITTLLAIIISILVTVCFFCFGYISKELVLYGIEEFEKEVRRKKAIKKIIDNNMKN